MGCCPHSLFMYNSSRCNILKRSKKNPLKGLCIPTRFQCQTFGKFIENVQLKHLHGLLALFKTCMLKSSYMQSYTNYVSLFGELLTENFVMYTVAIDSSKPCLRFTRISLNDYKFLDCNSLTIE